MFLAENRFVFVCNRIFDDERFFKDMYSREIEGGEYVPEKFEFAINCTNVNIS